MKYLWLIVVRFTHKVLNKFPSILSYFFLAFSVIACLVILVPSCFDRVPVLSYYISEHELPKLTKKEKETFIIAALLHDVAKALTQRANDYSYLFGLSYRGCGEEA